MRPLARTKTTKNTQCETFVYCGHQVKHKTGKKYFSQQCCFYLYTKRIPDLLSTDVDFLYIINGVHDKVPSLTNENKNENK